VRTLLVFLLVFCPLAGLLWWETRREAPPPPPPTDTRALPTKVLFGPRDVAGARSAMMLQGEVLQATDLELELVDGRYVQIYVGVDRLTRVDDEPRLETVRVALFDAPVAGHENLRMVLVAPWLAADAGAWLEPEEGGARVLRLSGGVQALDANGRQLARVEELAIDVGRREVSSSSRLDMSDPATGVELHADGVRGSFELREVELLGAVTASVPAASGRALLSGVGPALVRELPSEPGAAPRYELTLDHGVRLDHRIVHATADHLVARASREDGRTKLVEARVGSPVRLEFEPELASGLEWVEARALMLREDGTWALEGPVHGRARGPLPLLRGETRELGQEGYTFEAGLAEIRLGAGIDAAAAADPLAGGAEIRFDGDFVAHGDDGRSTFRAGTIWLHAGRLKSAEVAGGLRVETPELFVQAPGASFSELAGEERARVQLDGPAVVRAEGLAPVPGPLGTQAGGSFGVEAGGGVTLERDAGRIAVVGEQDVVAALGDQAGLRCARLEAEVTVSGDRRDLSRFVADGTVVVDERGHGLHVEADRLVLDGDALVLDGAPATASLSDGTSMQAARVTVKAGAEGRRELHASGSPVKATLPDPLGKEGVWTVRAPEVSAIVEDGARIPVALEASMGLVAERADGLRVSGQIATWDRASGLAVLRGEPAVLERGADLRVEAPGFSVTVGGLEPPTAERPEARRPRLEEASTLGPATIEVAAALLAEADAAAAKDLRGFRRFHIVLAKPATLRGALVETSGAATVTGFGAEEAPLLQGNATRVEIEFDPSAPAGTPAQRRILRMVGYDGVRLEGSGLSATAREMVFEPATGKVVVQGDAHVEGEGWDPTVSFEALEFVLTQDGIDLRRAERVRVRDRNKAPE